MQNWNNFFNKNNFNLNQEDLTHFCATVSKLARNNPFKIAIPYDLNKNGKFDDGEFVLIKAEKNKEFIILNQSPKNDKSYMDSFNLKDDNKIGINLKSDRTQKNNEFGCYEIVQRRPFPCVSRKTKTFEGFLNNLAFLESTYNNKAQNIFGYMGWFQMGEIALNDIGYRIKEKNPKLTKITAREFESNKDLQIELLKKRFEKSAERIAIYGLDKYIGKTVDIKIPVSQMKSKDIKRLKEKEIGSFRNIDNKQYFTLKLTVTPSGMLAGSHLCGDKGIKNFLKNGKMCKDGNGIYIFERMIEFGEYECPESLVKKMKKN